VRRVAVLLSVPILTVASLLAGTTAAPAIGPPAGQSRFGFMFPGLPGFTTPSRQQIADLAQTQQDPNVTGPVEPTGDDAGRGSAFTYLAQFVDHDLTLDTLPQPAAPVDPTTLTNARTFKFDLDSVYGGGPGASPFLYAADRKHFLVQNPSANGVRDLPRNPDGSAILVEGRNDENEIISQLHTAVLLFHNRLVDRGLPFALARQVTIWAYQTVVLRDLLPRIVGQDVVDGMLAGTLPRFYDPGPNPTAGPMTPVEFSVAAYRFGHSMVRLAYVINDVKVGPTGTAQNKIQVFNATNTGPDGFGDLRGGRPLPPTRQIDWGNFDPRLEEAGADPADANVSRKIDTLISRSLFALPIPGAEASGDNVLAFRNMVRAGFYNMASGQDVAAAMGLTPIPAGVINTVDHVTRPPIPATVSAPFATSTPLWYYILAESSLGGGKVLGPVGARIVADVFIRLLQADPLSILNVPTPLLAQNDPDVTANGLAGFLVDAGVATKAAP
jgi:hypothetical protein